MCEVRTMDLFEQLNEENKDFIIKLIMRLIQTQEQEVSLPEENPQEEQV